MLLLGAAAVASCEPWKDEDLAALASAPAYASLAAGLDRTCGIGTSGAMYCWGQAVLGTISPTEDCSGPTNIDPTAPPDIRECATRPIRVYGGQHWARVNASYHGVLAI